MRNIALASLLVVLGACSSIGGLGDLGTILGSPSVDSPSDVRGVVSSVNSGNQSITLDVQYVNNLRQSGSANTETIYYDSRTRVVYQGQDYRVEDLERGDEVSVRGSNNSGRYIAETITVTRNARG